jgi:hypothetical protein
VGVLWFACGVVFVFYPDGNFAARNNFSLCVETALEMTQGSVRAI